MSRKAFVVGCFAVSLCLLLGCGGTPLAVPTLVPTQASAPPSAGPTGGTDEVRIGVVYPLSGRLQEWGQEAQPFIQIAEADANALPEAVAAGVRFRFVVRSSETTAEGALAAVRDLVENEGIGVTAGLPLSLELNATSAYLTEHQVAAISSASTSPSPALRQIDTIFRISPPELYLARTFAGFAIDQGYRRAAVIYRNDEWGPYYAEEFAAAFRAQGYSTALVSIEPTHPQVGDYAAEVAQLSARVAELGADDRTVVLMAVWEGEDLNILHHAAQDPTLSGVRWLSALLYPSLLDGRFGEANLPDARDFALAHQMWGQEFRPPENDLLRRLWAQARSQLGREPRYEHVFLYDALQIAARAVLLAGSTDGDAVAAAIPAAAEAYAPATGPIRFDGNGDRASGNLAYYGLFQGAEGFEYRYYAFYDAAAGRFNVLPQPERREVRFCPEC